MNAQEEEGYVLPTFIIIGAPRAGTTTLYEHLKRHPEVGMSRRKETNYFAYDPDHPVPEEVPGWFSVRTLEAYAAQFAHARGRKAVGEASPIYLATPGAAARIHALLPRVRLIAVLRNPVDRAYSGYVKWLHQINRRLDPRTDFDPGASWMQPDSDWVQRGCYARLLRDYYEHFDPEQIRIFLYRDLVSSPQAVLGEIHAFIGVMPRSVSQLPRHNAGGQPRVPVVNAVLRHHGLRKRAERWTPGWLERAARRIVAANQEPPPPLPPPVRRRLQSIYRESVRDLEAMLGRDLGVWLSDESGKPAS